MRKRRSFFKTSLFQIVCCVCGIDMVVIWAPTVPLRHSIATEGRRHRARSGNRNMKGVQIHLLWRGSIDDGHFCEWIKLSEGILV